MEKSDENILAKKCLLNSIFYVWFEYFFLIFTFDVLCEVNKEGRRYFSHENWWTFVFLTNQSVNNVEKN